MSLKDRIHHLRTMRFLVASTAGYSDYARGVHDGLARAVHLVDGEEGEPKLLGQSDPDFDVKPEKTEPEQ